MFYSLHRKGKLKLALSNILTANQQGHKLLVANGKIFAYKQKASKKDNTVGMS